MTIYQGVNPVREVILHCAAINPKRYSDWRGFQMFAEINRWHRERGWLGFGYHAMIMPDGELFTGRPFEMEGAHVQGHNRGTLGLLLIESKMITRLGRFEDWFTEPQRDAARAFIAGVVGIERVSGHNDYARKLCPGFKVYSSDWL